MTEVCFQIKGSAVTTLVLELFNYSVSSFTDQLKEKIAQAPKLFERAPIIISLEKFDPKKSSADFPQIIKLCSEAGLQPLAFKGDEAQFTSDVKNTGLALLPVTAARTDAEGNPASRSKPVEREIEKAPADDSIQHEAIQPTKIVTQPVRSGQQIYAQGADLIVMSQVSEGAEVIADGHIHIYGALRGRALAGVKGNSDARIFCRAMEAELLSINGDFILSEDLRTRKDVWKKPAQVYRQNETLRVDAL